MQIIGFTVAFMLAIILISKDFNMGLSLLIASLIAGIFSLEIIELLIIIGQGIISEMSINLMIIVGLISGLGYIMKKSGDLKKMIKALNSLLKNTKLLMMFVPALIGTLNIPGGAILSAPMIEESGNRLKLNGIQKNTINLFFRHIGFFVYPLYPSMIIISELMAVPIISIIKYTFFVTLTGIITAYFVLFKNIDNKKVPEKETKDFKISLFEFISGFLSILIILVLALIFNLAFPYAVLAGTLVALFKNRPQKSNIIRHYYQETIDFSRRGIDYQLVFTIAGLMAFKSVIETTGFVNEIAEIILEYGISLPLLVIAMGLFAGYVTGVHMAATGILAPLFFPLIPSESIAVYTALLFVTINLGYLISPLHLCLALGNEYFEVKIGPVYKKLIIPVLIMIIISMIQVIIFA